MKSTKQISLCVIDDIKIVVDGITKQINWSEYGIELVGTALNGEKGLELIQQKNPSIIITDIRMPKMDGIEMLNYLRNSDSGLQSKVIFFSGYTEFEYVQQALRLGAFDFITKPFTINQIIEVVLKAKQKIQEEWQEQESLEEIKKQAKESLSVQQQEFLNLLLNHRPHNSISEDSWTSLQINLNQTNLAVMVIQIDTLTMRHTELSIKEVEITRFSLQNIVEETIHSYTKGVVVRDSNSSFVAIYNPTNEIKPLELAELCCEHLSRYTKFTVTIGHSTVVDHHTQLYRAYQEALIALSYHFYTGRNSVVMFNSIQNVEEMLPKYNKALEEELSLSLVAGNSEKLSSTLQIIFGQLLNGTSFPKPTYIVNIYYGIGTRMLQLLEEKIEPELMQQLESQLEDMYEQRLYTLADCQQLLINILVQACELVKETQLPESTRIINEAMQYIRAHLHTDLTIQQCADAVHLSRNYFVGLFKKTTGQTVVQFITKERIDKAKAMLLEGKQVQDIAAAVGYIDRRYFSDVFKKTTGFTPSEFKQQYYQTK